MKKFSCASIVAATLLGAGLMTVNLRSQNGTSDCEDRITSGGWIDTTIGTANFGASGGRHKGDLWGQLNFVNKEDDVHVTAKDVTGYCHCPGNDNCRRITYFPAKLNGEPLECEVFVEVCDNNEPGELDTFSICIPCIGYCESGVLGGDEKPSGGNIQLHKQSGDCEIAVPVCTGPPIGCEACFDQCN